jgi:hypothetical protein
MIYAYGTGLITPGASAHDNQPSGGLPERPDPVNLRLRIHDRRCGQPRGIGGRSRF